MALTKQNLNINFSQGIDTKNDPWQVAAGSFLVLINSVFDKGGLLQKRNGFTQLPSLSLSANNLTTFKGNALAIGTNIQMLSESTNSWIDKGSFTEATVDVTQAVRTSSGQTTVDVATNNGLACAVWIDSDSNNYYQIVDSITGQVVVSRVQLPASSALPRVFSLGNHFIISYFKTVAGVNLFYIAIPVMNPSLPNSPVSLSTQVDSLTAGYDGSVANDVLYFAFGGSDIGGSIRVTGLNAQLGQQNTVVIAGQSADLMSVTTDISGPTTVVYLSYWDTTSNNGYIAALSQTLIVTLAPTQFITSQELVSITSEADNGIVNVFYEVDNDYSYTAVQTDYIETRSCTALGVLGSPSIILKSVGLASKAFYVENTIYMLVAYAGAYQPSYFLINQYGNIVARLAYSNGGGYVTTQILPNANVNGNEVGIGYLFKDLLAPVNKTQGVTNVNSIFSQLGINIVNFTIGDSKVTTGEIGGALHLTGGMLWMYDGSKPVEHGFNVWPEDILVTTATTGGNLADQTYFYQATYEWTDAAGNIHRSAPSVPFEIVTSGGGTSTNTLNIPYLRLTYKTTPNPVRIVIYRWSTAQQNYYQITSITQPIINDPSMDSVEYVDTAADADILGNLLIYTTGGVLENIQAPSAKALTIFKSRLFIIDGEDQNQLWYSKVTLENTPIEMTDLQTLFISATISSQGTTGVNECIFPMDDKLILYKSNAIYYFTGNGPDITGANNDYGDPSFITSTVGCRNPNSIVFTPNGLMFQSDKGIWILGRDLSTNYIGAPVQGYTQEAIVVSAVSVPGTNQIRFTMSSGITLMYDYYYNQWGAFQGIPGLSSTIYSGLHTYINEFNQTFRENVGSYLDGSHPVLMSFTTAWFKFAGLQGFQRAYFFYLLGKYYSPHKLLINIAYDYKSAPSQSQLITPVNFNGTYGSDPIYGDGSPYGGNTDVEQWRIFLDQQKCQSFQISLSEQFDRSLGTTPGYGLTLSGINLVVGVKKGYTTLNPNLSA